MHFKAPLLRGTLIKRYKRFFADVELTDGTVVTAHCPNTGAMTHCAEPGFTAYVSESTNPKRKLKYTWELAQNHKKEWIGINTHRANKLVEEALLARHIEPLAGFAQVRREVRPQGAQSRFDFLLSEPVADALPKACIVEVKSVTLNENGVGYFPDAVTARGARHCLELAEFATEETACTLVFCVQHSGVKEVNVAKHIDPNYADALRHAMDSGVNVIALGCTIDDKKMFINQTLNTVF
ncbi:DNA/RNA nuclease SfsA [Alteromonas oceanisediminis]|uniref:DNA/RNA nuclease SfsA n=1 Tax=Alteromonas oceanisediminis TaxID=2836180 RepID=UPI001BDB5FC6|nr:DNA/RNA nuclease SfsA [Alteromonas oceanisediminis]MBT0587686.1 DNA/RNA nuclease SfsA [Alteromonas oceanisediminis]